MLDGSARTGRGSTSAALIVDDDPLVRMLVRHSLRRSGDFSDVDEAVDLGAARGMLSRRAYGCVVLDLGLPDGDGAELLQELRGPTAPAVVVLTGEKERSLAMRLVRSGAQDFLDKGDVDPAAIVRSVRFAVQRRAMLREEQRATADAQRDATTDPLTGLLNRRGLVEGLRRRPAPGRFAAMIDADDFKAVNDRHGHDVGDAVLQAIAAGIGGALRPSGLGARLGGDEFLAVGDVGTASAALAFSERIQAAIDRNVAGIARLRDAGHRVSVSMGTAPISDLGGDLDAIVRRCTAALHASKTAGKDRIVLADRRIPRPGSAPDLDGLRVEAAPVLRADTGAVSGFELGSRAAPGTAGLADRLARARAGGRLAELEVALLDRRLSYAGSRLLRGTLMVPITLRALSTEPVLERLEAASRHLGPDRIVIWVWGDGAGPGAERVAHAAARLRAAGVGLGVGRVGRGGTALESLLALQPQLVRLDPALVSRLGAEPAAQDEVHRLVRLADALGAAVLAPGISGPNQQRAAALAGVRYVLGVAN